jgi:predicted ATPase
VAGFVLERVLGRGGMGVVWLAREPGLDRRVAVKVLAPELVADDGFRERFLVEMRLAASLDHPHVCPVYRAGEEDGLLFLVLRYVPGENLGASIAQAGALEPKRALELLGDLAAALDAAHAHGLLHRDVKPENVLLDEEQNAYLADFGLARSDVGSQATVAGSLAGTLAYLAPERIEGSVASPASDLYAFACLAFCVLSGAPPFVREHEAAVLYAHLREEPPSLAERGLGRLDPVFRRALAKRSLERHASCREFVDALEVALAGGEPEPSTDAWPETLPRPQTVFVGRGRELAQAAEIMVGGARLLTLTGPGGTGKTRLGLELTARLAPGFESGAHWLSLAALSDPGLLLATIANEFGEPDRAPAELIGARKLLLGLDNLEQLLPGAADLVAALLAACPNLSVIVTSRAPLRLGAERELAVPPLEEVEAVGLFVRRAEQHGFHLEPGDASVIEIVRRVDCLPLAVELAAARLRLLSPAALLARLDQRLRVLTGGPRDAPARQQTLTATLDWSHELLPPEEQQLFARLAVFAGGFTLETAETVCNAELDTLQGLLDASLLRRRDAESGDARYWMLAVVQEYAAAKLAELPVHDALHDAHAAFFRDLAEQAKMELSGHDVLAWLGRLDADHDNVRAALAWGKRRRDGEIVFGIATCMNQFWQTRGHLAEARQWLSEALDDELSAPAPLRATALLSASHIAVRHGDLEAVERLCQRNIALCEQTGDVPRLSQSLSVLAVVSEYRGDPVGASDRHERALALAREAGDDRALRMTLNYVALFELTRDNYTRARMLFEEGYVLAGRIGWRSTIAGSIYDLCLVDALAGEHDEVRRRLAEAISIYRELEDRELMAYSFIVLAAAEAEGEGWERAAKLLGAAESMLGDLGMKVEPLEQRLVDRALSASRAQLDAARWEQAHATGATLSFEEAVDMALADRSA